MEEEELENPISGVLLNKRQRDIPLGLVGFLFFAAGLDRMYSSSPYDASSSDDLEASS